MGDTQGSTPVRLGLQTSPPGYQTPLHSHPAIEGEGEAWIEGSEATIPMKQGITLVMPINVRHYFRAHGDKPLKTYGIHVSPHRVVVVHDE